MTRELKYEDHSMVRFGELFETSDFLAILLLPLPFFFLLSLTQRVKEHDLILFQGAKLVS
jgi:hypothetical protein